MFIDYSDPNNVVITHNGKEVTGKILSLDSFDWWLHINFESNYYPANILDVDYSEFIKSVLGYSKGNNGTNSRSDLIRVLDAFNKEYDKKFGNDINPEDLKDGDYIYIKAGCFEAIYIFKSFVNTRINRYVYYDLTNNRVYILDGHTTYTKNTKIRKATSDEVQTLNKALCIEKGLFWNPISKQLEKTSLSVNTATNKIIADEDPHYYDYCCGSEQPPTPSEAIPNISIKWASSMFEPIVGVVKPASMRDTWDTIKPSTKSSLNIPVTINNFITKKKHYQLNFNN